MKKLLFLAAMSSVALASCVSDESPSIDATPSGKAISFNAPVMYSQTKAVGHTGEIVGTYPTDEEFCVYAVWTPESYTEWNATGNSAQWYMSTGGAGIKVTHNPLIDDTTTGSSGAWAPETNYYWPKNGYLTFAAYSPADAHGTFSYGEDGLTITNFDVNGTASTQYDLMYSERTYNKQKSTDGTNNIYDGVDIKFNHALSSIKFKVKLYEDYDVNTIITLTGITVNKVNSKGDFKETITDGASYDAAPEWTNQTDEISTAYIAYPKTTETQRVLYNGGTAQELKEGPNQTSNDLILLPQTLTDNAIITVYYTIKSKDSGAINQSQTVKINDYTPEWKIGKRYTYTIVFGLDKIYFAPEVDDWTDVTPGDINI